MIPDFKLIIQTVLFNDQYFPGIYQQPVFKYSDKIQTIIKPGEINLTVTTV